jgi:uncharacterized protein (TIGR02466 family)
MADRMNSEFNYRHLVMGHTPWGRLRIIKGFYESRLHSQKHRALSEMNRQILNAKLEHLIETNAPKWEIIEQQKNIVEFEINQPIEQDAFDKCDAEVVFLEKYMQELYELCEPTRIPGYTDAQMFEVNAANDFTAEVGKEIYVDLMANGRPSTMRLSHAMSNPHTFAALKQAGLLPENMQFIEGGHNPLEIGLNVTALQVENKNYAINYSGQQYPIVDSQSTVSLQSCFGAPIYHVPSDVVNNQLLEYVNNLEFRQPVPQACAQTVNSHVLNEPPFAELKKFIEYHLQEYVTNVMQVKINLQITQSWLNISTKGARHKFHTHPNSIFSGIFYLNFEPNHPPVCFYPPTNMQYELTAITPNQFNSQSFTVKTKTGDLILFPSHIPHQVEENSSDTPRISLSFNTFAIDGLGDDNRLTGVSFNGNPK